MPKQPNVYNMLKEGGQKIPAVELVSRDPQRAAIISKLVKDFNPDFFDKKGNKKANIPINNNFKQLSQSIINNIIDNENVRSLFPEIKTAELIITSSIMSPQDMGQNKIHFDLADDLKSSDIANLIIKEIRSYFTEVYKIDQKAPDILRRVLFETGSFPFIVLPENSLDELINGSYNYNSEAFKSIFNFKPTTSSIDDKNKKIVSLGYLNQSKEKDSDTIVGFESFNPKPNNKTYNSAFTFDNHITLEDNFNILKLPLVLNKKSEKQSKEILKKQNLNSALNFESIEDGFNNLTQKELSALFFKPRQTGNEQILKVKRNEELKRNPIGRPLILEAPSESIIPIIRPNNEFEPICYIALLDSTGNFINHNSERSNYQFMDSQFKNNGFGSSNMASQIIQKARDQLGSPQDFYMTFNTAAEIYGSIMESEILSRLPVSNLTNSINFSENNELYKTMLSRSLRNQYTQMLYIPKELITYFSFDVDKNGIGKSLLDDSKLINSLRATIMIARVFAQVKNSIPRTTVTINYDPDDPDPSKSAETLMHVFQSTRSGLFPSNIQKPGDIVEWAKVAGVDYVHKGHPGLPEYELDVTEKQTSYATPDNELSDDLRNKANNSLGINSEQLSAADGPDFATVAEQNDILFKQRIKKWQVRFCEQLTGAIKNICFNDSDLLDKLYKFVLKNEEKIDANFREKIKSISSQKEAIFKMLISEIFNNIIITLPEPDSTNIKNQSTALEEYVKLIDAAIDSYVGSDLISATFNGDSLDSAKSTLKELLKAKLIRDFLIRKNILPELTDLFAMNEDGITDFIASESITEHSNALSLMMAKLVKQTFRVKKALEKDLEILTNSEGVTGSGSDSGSDYSSDSSYESDSETTSEDDFDMDSDTSAIDETMPDEPSVDTEKIPEEQPEQEVKPEESNETTQQPQTK